MAVERRRIRVSGTVQGVGFRPFVFREAADLALGGYVRNDSAGVLIEVQGPAEQITELCRRLVATPPPLARVEGIEETAVAPVAACRRFEILSSDGHGDPDAPVSVDSATCAECLADIDNPANRRYRYPFTNCTNCGPRYTIVLGVPYDRPATTMAGFTMCAACQREYEDPADRRFHAQPNACPDCGPTLRLIRVDGTTVDGDDALDAAAGALAGGAILAVKGLGGYHLAADATCKAAVAELRRRKHRDDKPFALMVGDLDAARLLVHLDAEAEQALVSNRRPIVLAPSRGGSRISPQVAPGLPELGVMLPYTPLHHLLLGRLGRSLVLTSGNLSDEPIAHEDADALARLRPLVDGWLTHDRPIHIRCDDSVVRATGAGMQVLRRSRGFAPEPLRLPITAHQQILAVGAELKNTVAVARGATVIPSHHIGDLEHLPAYQAFTQAVDHLCRLHGVSPDVVAHDLHPEYLSTKFATDLGLPTVGVQHHHAHVASCLVDHGRSGPVLGVAFDGHGWGPDGTLWGGEFLVADLEGFERVGHLAPVPLPGGTRAIREPWRMAVTWMQQAAGDRAAAEVGHRFDDRAGALLGLMAAPGTLRTTSMGRLFDAAAALIGGRARVSYEGQAAIELEAMAAEVDQSDAERHPVDLGWDGGALILDPSPLIARLRDPGPPARAAATFHRSIGAATAEAATILARHRGLDTVVLTGGVFQNRRLSRIVASAVAGEGLEVLEHRNTPPNDGGISIGQAAVAAGRSAG